MYSAGRPRPSPTALQSDRMPDPRLQLSTQELVYAASALRAEARRAERQAADPTFHASRAIFEESAQVYDALAGKLTRIAEQLTRALA